MNARVRIAPSVARALAEQHPVVALETTVVTHGLPHPEGVAAALALEAEVRDAGAGVGFDAAGAGFASDFASAFGSWLAAGLALEWPEPLLAGMCST